MSYRTLKEIIKEHEIARKPLNSEELKYVINLAVQFPTEVAVVRENIRLFPIILGEHLDDLLDNGKLKQYEFVKTLIRIYL